MVLFDRGVLDPREGEFVQVTFRMWSGAIVGLG